jgi:polyisoprenoid-binding protein YceI
MTAQLPALRIQTGTWRVSDSRTQVGFTVTNFGRPVRGSVACSVGEVEIDDAGAPVRVYAELDLESLATGIAKRDADLRKPRFLDVDRHPVMRWAAERFTPTGDGGWTADGVLSVRGTTAPLAVTGSVDSVDPGGEWLRVRAEGVIDRTAVGIRAPSVLIGRSVAVRIDAWLVRTHRV